MKNSLRLVFFGSILAIWGCGPKSNGPSVPSSSVAQGAGADGSGTPGPSPTPNPSTVDTSSPYDATVAHRLLALPSSLQEKVKACEVGGKFFNLGDQVCSESPLLASPPCIINDTLKAALDPSTLGPLDTYLSEKVSAHRLYACTEEGPNFVLHFYKYESGVVNYKKLNIAKKPS